MSDSAEVTKQESQQAAETEGHIVQTGGSSPVSFDEFESLEVADKVKAKMEAKKEKQKESLKKGQDPDAKKSEPKPEKQAEPEKAAKTEEKPESTGEPQADPKEPQESPEAAEKSQKVRAYKILQGEDKITLRGDTKLPVKSDGEVHEVAIQDLMNSWSGHKAVDKRLGEFGAEKQKFIESRREIDNTIKYMAQAVNDGRPQLGLMRFFEVLGADPIKGLQDLKKSFVGGLDFEKLSQMTSEEREQALGAATAQDYQTFYEAQKESKASEARQTQLNTKIDELQKSHGIDDETFNKIGEELFTLKEQGKLQETITPEMIINAAIYDREIGKSRELVSAVDSELSKNQEAVEKARSLLKAGLSSQDIVNFIASQYKNEAQTPAQDALSKKLEKTQGTEKVVEQKNPQNEDMWSFDHL